MKNRMEVIPDLKIGYSCLYMNVSALFEYRQMLSLALLYSNFDFIYHPDYITTFINPRPAEEYISKSNDLVIVGSIDSLYLNDFTEYIEFLNKEYQVYSPRILDIDPKTELAQVELEYLKQNQPILFRCDPYYFYDDYRKMTSEMILYHSGFHQAVLAGIDFEESSCYVIDKFFSFAGDVQLDNYLKANQSELIPEGSRRFMTVDVHQFLEMAENQRLRKLLKLNIEQTLKEDVTINERFYYKGFPALQMFVKDFPKILQEMYRMKGKYAPQFVTKLLAPIILHRDSFKNMMRYVDSILDDPDVKEIIQLAEKVGTLWVRIDNLCDKCYLKGHIITDYTDRFVKVVNEIEELEEQVLAHLRSVYAKLD